MCVKTRKKRGGRALLLCTVAMLCILLTACGQNEELTAYQEDMDTFFEHIGAYNDSMNAMDA